MGRFPYSHAPELCGTKIDDGRVAPREGAKLGLDARIAGLTR